MGTYYCVKRPGECDGTCDICPVEIQYEFEFMQGADVVEDDVNRPSHYTMGGIETYDYITSWEMSFAEGNVIKYVTRAPYKGTRLKDLKKARWYLDQLIAEAERADG